MVRRGVSAVKVGAVAAILLGQLIFGSAESGQLPTYFASQHGSQPPPDQVAAHARESLRTPQAVPEHSLDRRNKAAWAAASSSPSARAEPLLKTPWPFLVACFVAVAAVIAFLNDIIDLSKLKEKLQVIEWRKGPDVPLSHRINFRFRRYSAHPSASQHLRTCLKTLIARLERQAPAGPSAIEKLIADSLAGRDQLTRPVVRHFLEVLAKAKKSNVGPTHKLLAEAARHFLEDIQWSHDQIAKLGASFLEHLDGALVDRLILFDYSTPVTRLLEQLASEHPNQRGSVSLVLILAVRNLLSPLDTHTWKALLKKAAWRRLFEVNTVPFSEHLRVFDRLSRQGGTSILMTGAERISGDGKIVVFPGVRGIVTGATHHGIPVMIVAECYKVQSASEAEDLEIGTNADGYPVQLSHLLPAKGMTLITDHGIHSFDRGQTTNLKCCIRAWSNKVTNTDRPLGIVFDLDGTLMDTEEVHKSLYQQAARQIGYCLTDDEYLAQLRGMTDEDVMSWLITKAGSAAKPIDLVYLKQQSFQTILLSGRVSPMPGAISFLRDLVAERYPLALATSATKSEALTMLGILGATEDFDAIIDASQVRHAKPHPEVFQRAAEAIHLRPQQCLAYEDSIAGIQAATSAGMPTVAICRDDGSSAKRAGARMCITTFEQHRVPSAVHG